MGGGQGNDANIVVVSCHVPFMAIEALGFALCVQFSFEYIYAYKVGKLTHVGQLPLDVQPVL